MNIKSILAVATLCTAFVASADEALYSLVNDEQGYSYLQINADVDAFSFKSDFKSIGNSGVVGYYVLPADKEGQALKDYIASIQASGPEFGKGLTGGVVDLGAQKAGTRIGFYLERNNGNLVTGWDFQTKHGTTYIAFDKNGGKGKDEWMSFGEVTVKETGTGGNGNTSGSTGAPLPGALAVLLVGGLGLGASRLRKRAK